MNLETVTGEKSIEMLRLFIAIPIPDTIRKEMARVQSELRELMPREMVRWTKPEQFHLTLKFLGGLAAERVNALKKSIEAVCQNAGPLALCAQGIGFFPNARFPRVIWVGVHDETDSLAELQKQIEIAARPFAEKPGEEKFSGHATLGRFKKYRRRDVEHLMRRVQTIGDHVFGDWTAGEIELVQSETLENEARHTPIATFVFDAK